MNDKQMVLDAVLTPGPGAVAGMRVLGRYTDQPALVIFFDPECLAIGVPGGPGTWPEFVRFLRQLRDGAEELAAFLDNNPKAATEQGKRD